jgi:hypothetical protein
MRLRREISQWAAGIMIGGFLGAWLATGAASAAAPSPWFWPATWSVLALGLVALGIYALLGHKDARFLSSAAVTVAFSGEGTDSVMRRARTWRQHTTPVIQLPEAGWVLVRLRVTNARNKSIKNVRVSLTDISRIDGGESPKEWYPSELKWMGDNGPEHYPSRHGIDLGPGKHWYVDLYKHELPQCAFFLQYGDDHLATYPFPLGGYRAALEVDARDDETGRKAPVHKVAVDFTVDQSLGAEVEVVTAGFRG